MAGQNKSYRDTGRQHWRSEHSLCRCCRRENMRNLMGREGLEPSRPRGQEILSLNNTPIGSRRDLISSWLPGSQEILEKRKDWGLPSVLQAIKMDCLRD